MSDFVDKPIQKKLNKGNPISRIERLENKTGATTSARVNSLDQLSPDLGDQIQGRFVAPASESGSGEPTDSDFSGSFLAGEAQTPADSAGAFNLGIVSGGVTTYGVGPTGSYAYGESFAAVHKATGTSTNARQVQSGMVELQGNTDPSYVMEFSDTVPSSNLITSNPGFETGDTTGWTLSGGFYVVSSSPISGSYSLYDNTHTTSATSSKYAVTAGNILAVSFLAYASQPSARLTVYIRFYNATPTLLSTVAIATWGDVVIALNTYSANVTVPTGATQFEIYAYRDGGGYGDANLRLDDFSVTVVTASNKLGFHGKYGDIITLAEDNELAQVAYGTGQIAKWPFVVTGAASAGGSLDATANYYYQIAFVDASGGVSLPNTISAAIATTGVNKIITLSGVPKRPPGCTAIRIYRTEGGGAICYYLTDLATDAVTYVDSAADSSLNLSVVVATYNSTINRPFYPPYAHIMASIMLSNATITETFSVSFPFNISYGTLAANANDLDWYTFPVFIAAGTYTLLINGQTGTDRSKIDIYIDGTITGITAQDWYSAATTNDVSKTGSVTITTSGYHQLLLRVNGKNAASTDYRMILQYVQLTPVAY